MSRIIRRGNIDRSADSVAIDGIYSLNDLNNRKGNVPNAVTSLTALSADGALALSWTAPSSSELTITNYLVEYVANGAASSKLTESMSTSYSLTGLTNGVEYSVRVAAISPAGVGTYSNTSSDTPSSALLTTTASGFTGAGTESDKLRATDTTLHPVAGSMSISVNSDGTIHVSATRATSPDDEDMYFNGTFWRRASFSSYQTTSRSVSAGDTVSFSMQGGVTARFDNLQFWLVPS